MSRILFLGAPASPHAERWIRFLLERGHDVRVGTIHEVPPWAARHTERLRTRGDRSRPGSAGDLREAVPRLRGLGRAFRPEVTLAYYATSYGLMAALARLPRVTIATAGGDVLVDPFDSIGRRFRNRAILAIALRHAETVLAWSRHVAERLRELGVPEQKIFEQVRGIDLARFRPREVSGETASVPPLILSNRFFKPLYDLPTLLRALAQLAQRGVPLQAVLFGDGVERGRLEALAGELGLGPVVTMPGFVGEDAMVSSLARADVYVSTSTTDGASSSLFEAIGIGVYPIVTDIPANRAWIESGRNGRLFPVGDHAALARAIEEALADPAVRARAAEHNAALATRRLNLRTNLLRIEQRMLMRTGSAPLR